KMRDACVEVIIHVSNGIGKGGSECPDDSDRILFLNRVKVWLHNRKALMIIRKTCQFSGPPSSEEKPHTRPAAACAQCLTFNTAASLISVALFRKAVHHGPE